MNKRVKAICIVMVIIAALVGFLFVNSLEKNPELDKTKTYLIQGKENLIAVYKDKLAVKIPYDINIDKEKTVEDLVKNSSDETILETMNKILPEPLENYMVVKHGQIPLTAKNQKNIPETVIDNKRYILTSSLYSMFDTLYNEKEKVNELNENIIVDVLNANGRNGYARRTGETIKKNLGMKYNAANYETNLEESYIILNDISNDKAQDIVMQLNEKYFKIQQVPTIPTLANVVVVLGKEEDVPFEIDVTGNGAGVQAAVNELKKAGYKKVSVEKEGTKSDKKIIEYTSEDYFIAYKIARILDISDMIERDGLKNKVRVIIN